MPISPLRRAGAAVAAVGATAALVGSPASAQTPNYPPTTGPTTTSTGRVGNLTLALSARVVVRGQTITASVGGAAPGLTVLISIASVEQQLGTFTASSAGTASGNITIPTNISLGAHTVFARGPNSTGAADVASQPVTVVAASTGTTGGGGGNGKLARTGAIVVPTALVGLGLVAGGAALKRSSRRGKSSSAA